MVTRKEITVTLMIGKAVVLAVEVTEVVVAAEVAEVVVAVEVADVVVEEDVGVGGAWGTNDIGGYYTPFSPF